MSNKQAEELITRVERLTGLGWRVRPSTKGTVVYNTAGESTCIPHRAGRGRGYSNARADLLRMGLEHDEETMGKQDETARRARITADRSRTEVADLTQLTLTAPHTPAPVVEPAAPTPKTAAVEEWAAVPGVLSGDAAKTWLETNQHVMATATIAMTPDMATEFLERPLPYLPDGTQLRQRPRSADIVDNFVRILKAGKWMTTHQGLALGACGGLLDGQHRCRAVVESGITAPIRVTTGCPAASFATTDTGKKRTPGDVLSITGKKDAWKLSSVIKLGICLDAWLRNQVDTPVWTNWSQMRPTHAELLDFLEAHPEIEDALSVTSGLFGARWYRRMNQSAPAVFYWAALRAWPAGKDLLDEFMQCVASGVGLDELGNPALTLRDWFSAGGGKLDNHRRERHLVAYIRAWRHYVAGSKWTRVVTEASFPVLPDGKKPADEDGDGE